MANIRNRLYIPAKAFITVEDGLSVGVGTPSLAQITSRDLVGFLMTAAETVTLTMRAPIFLDTAHPIGFRLHWMTGSATSADTFDWIITHEFVIVDAAVPATITTALNTPIVQDTLGSAIAFINKWTERGILTAASQPTRAQVEAGALLLLEIELDATDASESIWLLGVELDYVKLDYVGTSGLDTELSSIEA